MDNNKTKKTVTVKRTPRTKKKSTTTTTAKTKAVRATRPKKKKQGAQPGNTNCKGHKNSLGNRGGGRLSIADQPEFVEQLYNISTEVLQIKHMYMFTDRLIIGLINEHLKPDNLILKTSTFSVWKKLWVEDRSQAFFEKRPILCNFFELFEKLTREAEEYLLDQLLVSAPGHWQKYAWILERRYKSWQMESAKSTQPIVQVVQLNLNIPSDIPIITSERQMLETEGEYIDSDEVF